MTTTDLRFAFKLPGSLATTLRLLLEAKLVTAQEIVDHKIATNGKVCIYRLRQALKPHGIEIKCQRDLGYWLEPSMKDRVIELADLGQQSFALDHGAEADGSPTSAE